MKENFISGIFLDLLGQYCSSWKQRDCSADKMTKGKGKRVREKGKLSLSSYFKKIEDGASVALVTDAGVCVSYPKRMKGMSGKIVSSRGKFKLVEIKDGNKLKTLIVHPVHLRKL